MRGSWHGTRGWDLSRTTVASVTGRSDLGSERPAANSGDVTVRRLITLRSGVRSSLGLDSRQSRGNVEISIACMKGTIRHIVLAALAVLRSFFIFVLDVKNSCGLLSVHDSPETGLALLTKPHGTPRFPRSAGRKTTNSMELCRQWYTLWGSVFVLEAAAAGLTDRCRTYQAKMPRKVSQWLQNEIISLRTTRSKCRWHTSWNKKSAVKHTFTILRTKGTFGNSAIQVWTFNPQNNEYKIKRWKQYNNSFH